MKNNKKIIIGTIILILIVISFVSIYYSRQGLTRVQVSSTTSNNNLASSIPQASSSDSSGFDTDTASTTTTVKYNGYTISLWRDYLISDGSTDGTEIYIRDKNGQLVFSDWSGDDFVTLGAMSGNAKITKAKDFITKALKNVTGDGTPYIAFANWLDSSTTTDKLHSGLYIIGLGSTFTKLLNIQDYGDGFLGLIDNGAGKPMSLQGKDGSYHHWPSDVYYAPMPKVFLRFDEKTYSYIIDTNSMQKSSPTHIKILSEAKGWTADAWAGSGCDESHKVDALLCTTPWAYALDLIYSGNAKVAREYIDLAWKPNNQFISEKDFLGKFTTEIQSSLYYKLAPASFWQLEYLQ
jgi:hypothetical protein